jgi:hypothetical protein
MYRRQIPKEKEASTTSEDIQRARAAAVQWANGQQGDIATRKANFVKYLMQYGNLGRKETVYARWAEEPATERGVLQ